AGDEVLDQRRAAAVREHDPALQRFEARRKKAGSPPPAGRPASQPMAQKIHRPSSSFGFGAGKWSGSGALQTVGTPPASGYGPEIAGQGRPGKTSTAKISSTPEQNSRWATRRPDRRSTMPTPQRSSCRRSEIGNPPKVDVSRILDRPTKANRSWNARPRV